MNARYLPTFIFLLVVSYFDQANAQTVVPEKATDIAPLLYGEQAPEDTLISLSGAPVALRSLLAKKPTVLIFYRGGWCPYCNTQLQQVQTIQQDILDLGYQIIAVSPDSPARLATSTEKNNLSYQLYSDAAMEVAKNFGIAFMASEGQKERLTNYSEGKNPGWLPVPSVFVLSPEGEILFEFINPNYKVRLSGELLLAVLKALD